MNKFILIGIMIVIIIGIVSVLLLGIFLAENGKEGTGSTSGNPKELSKKESIPKGRNLTIEFDEKMGFSAP